MRGMKMWWKYTILHCNAGKLYYISIIVKDLRHKVDKCFCLAQKSQRLRRGGRQMDLYSTSRIQFVSPVVTGRNHVLEANNKGGFGWKFHMETSEPEVTLGITVCPPVGAYSSSSGSPQQPRGPQHKLKAAGSPAGWIQTVPPLLLKPSGTLQGCANWQSTDC